MPVKLKETVYKTVVRPALLYGEVTWATTRGQEARLEVNAMRMLRWMCGVTRRDHIQNEHNRGTTRVVQVSTQITEQRLKWYGHVRGMKGEHTVRRMLDGDIPVKRRRGRSNLGWKDVCKRDMTQTELKEDKATNRVEWRKKLISYTGDPRWRDKPEMKKMGTHCNNVNIFFKFIVCVFIGGSALVNKTSINTAVPSVLRSWTQGPSPAAASRVIYVFFKINKNDTGFFLNAIKCIPNT